MKRFGMKKIVLLGFFLLTGLVVLISRNGLATIYFPTIFNNYGYVVLAWNDLGMHCYNRDFQDLGVLPPYNNLWAQVIKVGKEPQKITTGITVTYRIENNTYSVGKSNFWQYAQQLFGLAAPLPDNVGLTGKGLSGTMDLVGNHFQADGIPLTEFRDSSPTVPYPYQLATIIVTETQTGRELARTTAVAPVSTEMHCDSCHYNGGVGNVNTGKVETNILQYHDNQNGTNLMSTRPVLCANCHGSNALGKPGNPNLPNFSKAMHSRHSGKVPNTLDGCYQCHPGPNTKCLRDVMFQQGMTCISCHGSMSQVAQNSNPWLNEPRCDSTACHGNRYAQNQPLYRHSTGHGGVYCSGCHDSPHAIAPTTQANDAIKFIAWQGFQGTLRKCTVCHVTQPTQPGPHNITVGR
jgi:hypothetical protein